MGYRGLACVTAVVIAGLAGASGCGDGSDATTSLEVQVDPASHVRAPRPAPTEGRKFAPPPPTVVLSAVTAEGRDSNWVIFGTSTGPCLIRFYPEPRNGEGGGACGEGMLPDHVRGGIQAWGSSNSDGRGYVTGFLAPEVDAVRVEFETDVDQLTNEMVAAAWIAPDVLRATGTRPRLGLFSAWLPDGVGPADVTATALDDEGETIGTAAWPDFASE